MIDLKNLSQAEIERLEKLQAENGSVTMDEIIKPNERYVPTVHNSIGSSGYSHIIKPLLPGTTRKADSLSEANSWVYFLKLIEFNKRIEHEEPYMIAVTFQPIELCFLLQKGTNTYQPDFLFTYSDYSIRFGEHKGRMDPKSKTKINRFSTYYPKEAREAIYITESNITTQEILKSFNSSNAQIEILRSKDLKDDAMWSVDDYSPFDGELLKWWTSAEYKELELKRDKLEREDYNELPFETKEK